jgi:hypothetical protein
MAITRLTDFITVATSKWTYGDSAFKYEGEVNQDHDTIYPLMVMIPPTSRMPDIYEGWEHYNVEMEFYNSYQTAAQNAVTLQQRWDNLQDLAMEWLDQVLINYSGGALPNPSTSSPTPTQVYIDKESLQIDRIKNDKNDKLCRITMRFDMRMFTRCFTPQSSYPNDVSDLVVWLSADSNVTFNIPTKKVSSWTDRSGQSNSVAQATSSKQPLRYGYDGAADKSRINFNGTSQHFTSDNNAPITANDFTVFAVFKYDNLTNNAQKIFTVKETVDRLNFGINNQGRVFLKGKDDVGFTGEVTSGATEKMDTFNIAMGQFEKITGGTNINVQWNKNAMQTTFVANFNNNNTGFDDAVFNIGFIDNGTADNYFTGDLCELIVYNKALNTSEADEVRNYLNNKYKIY